MRITRPLCQTGTRVLTVVIGDVLKGSSFVAQAGLKFATICLPLPEFAMPGSLFGFSFSLPLSYHRDPSLLFACTFAPCLWLSSTHRIGEMAISGHSHQLLAK